MLPILEHIEKLRKKAVEENEKLHKKMKSWREYYTGDFSKKCETQLNITKGIIDTKDSFILDNEIVSSVTPKSKSFANINQVGVLDDVASILNDCNRHILTKNNFDNFKKDIINNYNVCGLGVCETYWEQEKDDELGDVKLVSVDPLNYFPDTSAKKVQDCNYIFIKEVYSSITLKKLYPQFIDEIDKAKKETSKEDKAENKADSAIVTVGDQYNTTQMYTDGAAPNNKVSQAGNVIVWKCYLKDDSTFIADDDSQELIFEYPNGRMIKFIEGADDYVLEDKPIDYPFGFPIDIIKGQSTVKYITDIQDRINKAFTKIRYLVGGLLSFLAVTPDSGLSEQDIINQLVVEVDQLNQMDVITSNTAESIKYMVEYIKFLKEQAYEITRVNPALISGQKEQGVDSGKMVEALNDSPMTAIREVQKLFKNFIITQGNKNITLIQLYYTVPRIVRLSGGDLAYIYPGQQQENQQPTQPIIKIYKQNAQKQYEALKEINADLSIGEYEVEVIAGTELPRSRSEKAKLMLQLADMGKIPSTPTGTEILLDALDIPDKTAILEANEEAAMSAPKINIPLELAGKIFKDMPPLYQDEFLQQFGFTPQIEGEPNEGIGITA